MPMRGAARRARPQASVELRQFGWDRALVATLRHSTLPFGEAIDAAPLARCDDLGARDKLSLVAQFAAHQAFLQFAGVGDGECDPAEWAVARKRGSDCRLIRVASRAPALGGGRVVEIGGDASPLQRYSAIAALQPDPSASESAVVERVLEAASRQRFVFIVAGRERFDAASRRVIEMLEASDAGTWISDDGGLELPAARFF